MAISEESRHQLYGRLEVVLGPAEAATMMAHLPPVGWADVARRSDLDHFGGVLRSEMAALGSDLRAEMADMRGDLRAEIRGQTRSLFLSLVGLQMTAAALALGLSKVL
ncbi:MAG TPA: hypothetical protein VM933_07135 [Acidimicrobiales bacterium]|nr:hypothetical protein [Acidimicrobiales bacterium]